MPLRERHCSAGAEWEGAARSAREPGDLPPTVAIETLVERGWLKVKKLRTVAVAGVVMVLACAGTALAGPTVTVRVEGQNSTLLERTQVTLPDTGLDICGGKPFTAASALDVATHGNWDRKEFASTILGESHTFAQN